MNFTKNWAWVAIGVIGVVMLIIVICNILVVTKTSDSMYVDINEIPHNRYGMLLGTSPITPRGTHNFYFDNRVEAAAELYHAGKIDTIIASGGDYRATQTYGCDEPAAMRDSLVARGVPLKNIILDYDGTRTIKSFRKARYIYKVDSLTIISQEYHNQRSIYTAQRLNINAIAFNAKEPSSSTHVIKNHLREYLARVKMFIDLYIGSNEKESCDY